jgi:thioredoxin-related protein
MSLKPLLTAAILGALLLSASLAPTAAAADEKLWTTSFAKAKELAAKEGKDILMEFTGSDWCPPCIALNKNVLTKEVFKVEATKKFVLLKLDNPRDKSKQTKEEQAQYKELSSKFNVTGVPTIFLADAKGRPYSKQVGYSGAEAKQYVEDLASNTETRERRDEYLAKAEKAEGAEKAELLDKALAQIDTELVVSTYKSTVEEIIAADAKDESGLKSKYEGKLKLSIVKAAVKKVQQGFKRSNPDAGIEKLDKLVADMKLSGEGLQEVLYVKSLIQFQTQQKDKAKKTLEAALKAAPETKKGAHIEEVLLTVFKPKAEPKKDDTANAKDDKAEAKKDDAKSKKDDKAKSKKGDKAEPKQDDKAKKN